VTYQPDFSIIGRWLLRPPPLVFIKEQELARETIEVPITGKIISVEVKAGDKVTEGDTICILESMKMENPILTPVSGTVIEIGVAAEQVVKPGEKIAVIEY
jgi:acetyl-CoA carboxylase biotin carboxyl carrier protein